MVHTRDVITISRCWVNTTGRRGIKQLRIYFGSICLLHYYESCPGATFIVAGANPQAPPLNNSPGTTINKKIFWLIKTPSKAHLQPADSNFRPCYFFHTAVGSFSIHVYVAVKFLFLLIFVFLSF